MSESKNEFDRITPAAVALTGDEPVSAPPERPQHRLEPVLWGSVLAALLLAVVILMFMPEFEADVIVDQEGPQEARDVPQTLTTSPGSTEELLSPFEQAQQQKRRKAAQDILEQLVEQQYLLEDMSVALWGQDDLEAALAVAQEGDAVFLSRDYEGAANRYREARSRLDELANRGNRLFENSMAQGLEALDDGNVTAARTAFETAVAVDGDSHDAQRGLERAAKLNQVLVLLAQAEALEIEDRYADALERYQQVVEVDPDTRGVTEAMAAARRALREQSFRKAMTAGYAALSDNDHARARSAFKRAQRISDNREARDALAEVDMQVTLAVIARHQHEATAAMTDERWDDAVRAFEAALAVDSTLLFAVDGIEIARRRALLDRELISTLGEPARLSSDDLYTRAVELYRLGVANDDGSTRLTEQLDTLETLLELYRVPVPVTFRSDNATDVTLLLVAQLGRFSSRELQLRPGFYTIVGARNGYRDVRRQIEVMAGEPTPSITVQCDEKI